MGSTKPNWQKCARKWRKWILTKSPANGPTMLACAVSFVLANGIFPRLWKCSRRLPHGAWRPNLMTLSCRKLMLLVARVIYILVRDVIARAESLCTCVQERAPIHQKLALNTLVTWLGLWKQVAQNWILLIRHRRSYCGLLIFRDARFLEEWMIISNFPRR